MDDLQTGAESAHDHTFDRRSSWAEHNWGWVLALGVAAIAFGVALLGSAFISLSVLAWLAGLYLLFMGVTELFVPLRSERRGSRVTGAAIAVAGGIVLLVWPGKTLTVLAVVAGIAVAAWGVTSAATALRSRREGEGQLWSIVAGIGLVVLGILIMVWPSETVAIVGVIMGLVALVWGVVTALGALDMRRAGVRFEEARRLERQRAEIAWLDIERSDEAGTAGERTEEIQPPDVKAA